MLAASALAIAIALPHTAQAQAVPAECDPDVATADATIVCVAPAPEEIEGISTEVDDLTIVIGNDDTPTTVRGTDTNGVRMDGDGDQTLNVINADSQIIGDDDGISIVSDGGALTINSAGTSTGNDGDGIYAGNTEGSADLTVVSEGLAEGSDNGISANNYGSGALSITASDTYGAGDDGIRARNYAGTTDLTVTSTGLAEGRDDGISAVQNGSGALQIMAEDSYGATDSGIVVKNYSGTSVVINSSGSASGGAFGIYADNYGSGALTIDAVDTSGADSYNGGPAAGIAAYNSVSGTDLSITSRGTASSAVDGIFVNNAGTGALSIDAVNANGTARFGIFADNSVYGTDLILTTTGVVSGGLGGISADNEGSGVLVINAAETYGGGFFDAISAYGDVNGTGLTITTTGRTSGASSGLSTGISAKHYGSGAISINTAGEVIGGFGGISADNARTGSDVTISASALISGGSGVGIFATNSGTGSLSITATDVVSEEADGIRAANSDNSDSLSIVSTGTVQGGTEGIDANNQGSGALTIEVNNVIGGTFDPDAVEYGYYGTSNDTSNGNGITAFNSADGTDLIITSTGIAAGGENGIEATNRGSGVLTINANNSYGGTANPAATQYDYYGGFSNYTFNGNGIEARAGSDVTALTINSTGLAAGGLNGIDATNEGTGALTISANNAYGGVADPDASVYGDYYGYYNPTANGDGITALNGETATDLTITSTGTIIGGVNGISAENRGTGSLTITASNAYGGRVDPDASYGSEEGDYFNPTVDGNGIEALNGETATDLTITSTGTASGGDNGISAKNYGSGALAITANNSYGYGDDGISARNYAGGTDLTIRSTGYAYGYDDGISAVNQGSGALTITAADSTGGTDAGIIALNYSDGPLSVTSTGTASGASGIVARNYGAGALSIAAADTMGEQSVGIFAVNSNNGTDLSIVSTGTASGAGVGIYARSYASGTVSVTAADSEGDSFGILAQNFSGTDTTVISTGTARGVNRAGIRVAETGSGQVTIEAVDTFGGYSGIIAGSSGTGIAITSTGTALGGNYGIIARQAFRGELIINAVDVTATSGTGIYASSRFGAENISVTSTGTVTGAQRGITVLNETAGNITIDTVNTVGEGNAGIYAFSQAYNSDITITSRSSSIGDNSGIIVSSFGVEAITVTAKDTTGAGRNGIQIFAQFGFGDITVTSTGTAKGGQNGIRVYNEKSGSTIIDAVDTIGDELDGIYVNNTTLGGDLLISSTGTARGGQNGIQARNYGNGVERDGGETSGALRITAVNTYGGTGSGIVAQNGSPYGPEPIFLPGSELTITSTGIASGATDGITAFNDGTGALTITANNTVGAAFSGIAAFNTSRATDLAIVSTGTATGGVDGIYASNFGTGGLSISVAGDVTGESGDGISAYNSANDATGSTYIYQAPGTITRGAVNGIDADNAGGSLTIVALGTVIGEAGDGIEADNLMTATDLSITSTGLAEGGENGISAKNYGSGALSITANDTIGNSDDGIRARTDGNADGLFVVSTGLAMGEDDGISVDNMGTGATEVTAADSTGVNDAGIVAVSSATAGGIAVISSGTATGGIDGIRAINGGDGNLVIVANDSAGGSYSGITAVNEARGADISVTSTGTATGSLLGIAAFQEGTGTLSVTANNTAGGANGISARNEGAGTDVTVISTGTATGGVTGAPSTLTLLELLTFGVPGGREIVLLGIGAFNSGSGATTIVANDSFGGDLGIAALHTGTDVSVTSAGLAEGGFLGIGVLNQGSGALSIDANDTNGIGYGGILAVNATAGDVSVVSRGTATGAAFGIGVMNYGPGQTAISANNASGGAFGITASSAAGPVSITTTGTVQGGQDGISLTSFAGTADLDLAGQTTGGRYGVAIDGNLQGTVAIRNTGTLGGGQAAVGVTTPADEATPTVTVDLVNDGLIAGRVQFLSGDDRVVNNGTFDATADSNFGAGQDSFENFGVLQVKSAIRRSILGLERFLNRGQIDLVDGTVGTNLALSGNFEGTVNSLLSLDISFDGNGTGESDFLTVEGAATGSTVIAFNPLGDGPRVLTSDILLVDAQTGSIDGAFTIDGSSLNQGLVSFDVTFDAANNDFLLSSAPSEAVFRTASFAESARNLWLQSTDAWAREMAGLRNRTEPSESQLGGSSGSEAGFWVSSFGSKIKRGRAVNSQFNGIINQFDVGYDQDFFGIQAGVDLGSASFGYGLTGGYLSSELGFAGSADSVDYDVLNIGAYLRFDTGPFFGSVLAKYDNVSAVSSSVSGGYSADVDGDVYGATAEIGALFGDRSAFYLEPVASLSWFKATIDDFGTAQGSFAFDEGEGLLGKAGARIGSGFAMAATSATIYASGQYVHQFDGEDLATFTSGGQTVSFANPAIGDYADFALGLGIGKASDPVSGTFEANYITGDDVEGYGAAMRVRFRF
ncbi:hypothetical protein QWY75_13455 [Pontixanthobacter aestiaquae]|nr:hypothetical protein [Pontixanthobacter aestiaquae]MDN3647212.1 hypothetical protein [Pontixanthobacter aestiaquae]